MNFVVYSLIYSWGYLRTIDTVFTDYLASGIDIKSSSRYPLLALEWIFHGIPWLFAGAVALLSSDSLPVQQFWANVLLATAIDAMTVGLIKMSIQRPRPDLRKFDMVAAAPGDQFSFPSGHTSRAAMLSVIFIDHLNLSIGSQLFSALIPLMTGLSRVCLGRHYVSDVVAGLVLGYLEGLFVLWIWMDKESVQAIISVLFTQQEQGAAVVT